MERMWVFETLAVTVARIDFLDPALAGQRQARERGVRLEVRPVSWVADGSVYAAPPVTLHPAVCRIDLLESAPGAADRMHWHPVMEEGEPGDRVFEESLPQEPFAWLAARLTHLDRVLDRAGVLDDARHGADLVAVADAASEIVAATRDGLAWARGPWPVVRRDARGMATG